MCLGGRSCPGARPGQKFRLDWWRAVRRRWSGCLHKCYSFCSCNSIFLHQMKYWSRSIRKKIGHAPGGWVLYKNDVWLIPCQNPGWTMTCAMSLSWEATGSKSLAMSHSPHRTTRFSLSVNLHVQGIVVYNINGVICHCLPPLTGKSKPTNKNLSKIMCNILIWDRCWSKANVVLYHRWYS